MGNRIQSAAIIGGGPAGAALGAMLARKGIPSVIFQAGERPELIVGESLVPAVVPFLRELGIEDEVAGFSVYKPGTTVTLGLDKEEVSFDFGFRPGRLTPYAYNTPRGPFDRALLDAARRAGVTVVEQKATIETDGDGVRLTGESAEAAADVLKRKPDIVVDASGRARRIARLLKLPAIEGNRKDLALFTHMDRAELAHEGHIHVDRYDRGWGWRIPLHGRVSVGIVVEGRHLGGGSPEERFDRFAAEEPALARFLTGASRLTGVAQYTNYQLTSTRWVGPGWALLGDAAGFIDPIFSTGVYLALRGAKRLADAIADGSPRAFVRYEKKQCHEIEIWKRIIGYWYDGRLFTLFRVGRQRRDTALGRLINPHMTKHITRIFTGEAGEFSYSRGLLGFMVENALGDLDPAELEIG